MGLCSDDRAVLFAGPSIPAETLHAVVHPAIEIRPPVRRGDLPAVLTKGDVGILAIIDGEFFQTLAVSPKEILDALSRNIIVIGGGSMGAIRAVELSPYGMIGVGQVYDWYKTGYLTHDDDVAVSYGKLNGGYAVLNVPMVQVIWIVNTGKRQGWLSGHSAGRIRRAARRIAWQSRTWKKILASVDLSQAERKALLEASGRAENDIKCNDAIATVLRLNAHFLARTEKVGKGCHTL